MDSRRLDHLLEASEKPLIGLAALAVALHLLDLAGVWVHLGIGPAIGVLGLLLDLAFVLDLILKLVAGRLVYVRSPWFVVDLVSALPVLSSLSIVPTLFQGLRIVRVMRLLRVLRLLRALRVLRVLRVMDDAPIRTREERAFDNTLRLAVVAYALAFATVLSVVRGHDARAGMPDLANRDELWFVLGSILGIALLMLLSHYLVPAVFSRQVRALLNVALPRQVTDWFLAHPEAYGENVRMPATVVFCDLKGFTAATEDLPLEALKHHLERVLDAIVEAHLAQDLIIDKFIGDAVMSFRGGNLVTGTPEEHAYRVVRGALDSARAVSLLEDPYFKELKLGGASAPNALIGTFGASRRLSYTILGDRVNLASRLEGACAQIGVKSLFCERTHELVGARPDIVWRRAGRLKVSGKVEAVTAWEAFDARDPVAWIGTFHAGLDAWDAGDPAAARAAFQAVDAERPGGDPLARIYLEHIAALDPADRDYPRVLETRK